MKPKTVFPVNCTRSPWHLSKHLDQPEYISLHFAIGHLKIVFLKCAFLLNEVLNGKPGIEKGNYYLLLLFNTSPMLLLQSIYHQCFGKSSLDLLLESLVDDVLADGRVVLHPGAYGSMYIAHHLM